MVGAIRARAAREDTTLSAVLRAAVECALKSEGTATR